LNIASELQDELPFVFTQNDVLKLKFKYSKNAVVVFKPPQRINEKYEKPKSRFPSTKLSVDALRKFAEEAHIPLVAERNADTEGYFSTSKKPVLTTFFDVEFTQSKLEGTETQDEGDQACLLPQHDLLSTQCASFIHYAYIQLFFLSWCGCFAGKGEDDKLLSKSNQACGISP
jgi:hypothetical protein